MLPMVQRFTAQRPGKSPGAPAAARPGTEEAEETSQAWPKKLKGRLGWKNPRPTWASCHKPTMTGEIWVLFWGLPHWYQAIHVYISKQKGTPWECGFSLHSATTDTAHVPWFCHCFATIDNFCLFFLQWLNKNKIKKKQETKNTKKTTTWQDPTLCHYSPHWGVQSCFFILNYYFWSLGFLVSCFLVRCWFLKG